MSVAIRAAVEKLIRVIEEILPVGDRPGAEVPDPQPLNYWGDLPENFTHTYSRQVTFAALRDDPPSRTPDVAIRGRMAPVEGALREAWRLAQGNQSSQWEYLRLLLAELLEKKLYGYRWDRKSTLRTRAVDESGHTLIPNVLLVHKNVVPRTLLDDLRKAAFEPPPEKEPYITIIPGGFMYASQKFQLTGLPWKVLKDIAESRHLIRTAAELLQNCWKEDSLATPQSVKDAIVEARKALRGALKQTGLDASIDPIPCVDKTNLVWELKMPNPRNSTEPRL
jgi:hypothetical protein